MKRLAVPHRLFVLVLCVLTFVVSSGAVQNSTPVAASTYSTATSHVARTTARSNATNQPQSAGVQNRCYSYSYTCDNTGYYGQSTWGFPGVHNCTNYAAWRLSLNGVPQPNYNLGNASNWASAARAKGVPVNGTPAVGAIAQWNAYTNWAPDKYGHVGYVDAIGSNYIEVVADNYPGSYDGNRGHMDTEWFFTTGDPSWPSNFIHFKDLSSPPPPPPTMVMTASAVPSPLHHPADFSLHAGTQVAEYNSTTNSFSFQGTWVQPVGAIDWAAAGDFNGDGVADFAIHANNAIYVYLSTKTSFVFQGSWVSPVGAFDWGGVGDFNGDGKADFALHANNAIYVYLSTGTSFAFQGSWVSPVGAFDWGGVGDFNGDGKADFALHNNGAIYTYLSTGTSFVFQGSWVSPVGAFDWGGVGDFNGDGKADFALHANNAIYVYLSTGTSFAFQGSWVSPVGAFDWGGVGDVNGDGKADFALHANNAIYVYLSTGTGFAFQGSWVAPVGAFDSGWLADFNGN